MEHMKKIITLIVSFLCIALSLWVVAHNLNDVPLSLGVLTLVQPQWVWLLVIAFIGFFVTALGYQARIVSLKLQLRKLRKQILLQGKAKEQKNLDNEASSRLSVLSSLKK
jgi:uncharacterized integral membrane protein